VVYLVRSHSSIEWSEILWLDALPNANLITAQGPEYFSLRHHLTSINEQLINPADWNPSYKVATFSWLV
jgi:hypothetical protein